MTAPPRFVDARVALFEALARMAAEQTSSLFVRLSGASADTPAATGIITERDIMRALAREGGEALAQTVETVASRPLQAVPAEAFIYRAIGRMSRLGIRHLGSVDKGGHIIGALSARDLLRVRGNAAVSLSAMKSMKRTAYTQHLRT